ncbi:tbc domain-containing protein [Stemphylium lycopersici]|uniref:Mediator of RNA polymerase II transcription subunit 31 n=1 Tax=Stemphylium lycopersici TaxID=183478 RepID=A0A364MY23_STELY|nr:tbc domain-containing protein [Stemphylium lycopersici]RAR00012.1 tbc domain-containing protein [Stemphylium lycopersici]RAR06970.1 tbc domain-containing protein [Stemphylium lycopersici]
MAQESIQDVPGIGGYSRFELELECLANPVYLNYLAQQKTLDKPDFVAYLGYLQYFKDPKYAKFLQKHWRQLDDFHSLTDLKIHVSSHKEPQITAGLRSVCWKIFLVFKTLDRSSWPTHLSQARKTYESLRSHYLRAIHNPDEFESTVDPLSELSESPWIALRADEELRAEIFQDIERCMPDNVYFRQPATQNMMLDILFVWCKMHPNIGYRQGMHEILAPVLWVVERDAMKAVDQKAGARDHILAEMMDFAYIEHDTHMLFSVIMQTAKLFYAPADTGSTTKDTPMLSRSSRIFEHYLPKVDPELHAHLVKLDIVPQIFLLRWIRLLFGREFSLDAVFDMWDALFAIDSTLELVDMISVAMLLRIRWELMAADTNEAFAFLLRYPEPATPPYTFIKDALYLRDHLTRQGGAEVVTRYGKKAPAIEPETASSPRDPSPSPSFVSSRTRNSLGSPRSFVTQQGAGFEALIQGAAKNVMDRGSQWGVGKALRDAVGEVKKNVEAYQSGASSGQVTPRSGGREFRKPAQLAAAAANGRPSLERVHSANTFKRMEELDRRNKSLAKMLEVAVGDLWEYHRERDEAQRAKKDDEKGKEAMEALSLAIAKVQFVQVYLEDSSIPLPVDEVTEQASTAQATATLASPVSQSLAQPVQAAKIPPISLTTSSQPAAPLTTISNDPSPLSSRPTSPPARALSPPSKMASTLSPRSRPHLTSSNFSWMLGEDSASSNFASGTAHSTFSSDEKRRMKGKGFLFGDDDDNEDGTNEAKRGSASVKTSAKGGKNAKGKHTPETEVEEEVIDLANMGKRGVI